eukprot:3155364-Prymnesium_polylepis.1
MLRPALVFLNPVSVQGFPVLEFRLVFVSPDFAFAAPQVEQSLLPNQPDFLFSVSVCRVRSFLVSSETFFPWLYQYRHERVVVAAKWDGLCFVGYLPLPSVVERSRIRHHELVQSAASRVASPGEQMGCPNHCWCPAFEYGPCPCVSFPSSSTMLWSASSIVSDFIHPFVIMSCIVACRSPASDGSAVVIVPFSPPSKVTSSREIS